jgi:hypothetical protein
MLLDKCGISYSSPGFDLIRRSCQNSYKNKMVYIRYIQTSDKKFKMPEGSKIGDRWDRTIQKVDSNKFVYSGNDSCVRLKSGWKACIDLMSSNRKFDTKARRLMPKKNASIDFYYKDQGEN